MKRMKKICLWMFAAIMMCGTLVGCGVNSGTRTVPESTNALSSNTMNRGSFDYLYPEILMTRTQYNENTKEMESHSLTVYLPMQVEGYVDTYSREEAAAERMGVRVEARLFDGFVYTINPDHSLEENLKELLEEQYVEYASEYMKDVEIAEPVETENRASATVSYLFLDYDGYYVPIDVTAVLMEMQNAPIFVSIEVDYRELDGEYEKLVSELEQAYEIDIRIDEEAAKVKMNTANTEDEIQNTPQMSPVPAESNSLMAFDVVFDIPEGWTKIFPGYYVYGEEEQAIAMFMTPKHDDNIPNFGELEARVKENAEQNGEEYIAAAEKPLGSTFSVSDIRGGTLMQAHYVDIGGPERCLVIILTDATGGSYQETLDVFTESLLTTEKLVSDEDKAV